MGRKNERIKRLRSDVEIRKFDGTDIIPGDDEGDLEAEEMETATETRAKMPSRTKASSGSAREDVYTLSSGDAILRWPEELSREDCSELEDWLNLILRKIKRSAPSSSPSDPENED